LLSAGVAEWQTRWV